MRARSMSSRTSATGHRRYLKNWLASTGGGDCNLPQRFSTTANHHHQQHLFRGSCSRHQQQHRFSSAVVSTDIHSIWGTTTTTSTQLSAAAQSRDTVDSKNKNNIVVGSNKTTENGDDFDRLKAVEQDIFDLCGYTFNLKSPKQVSTAIFGKVQSAAKAALEEVVQQQQNGSDDATKSQTLAALVLEHRALAAAATTTVPARSIKESAVDANAVKKQQPDVSTQPPTPPPCKPDSNHASKNTSMTNQNIGDDPKLVSSTPSAVSSSSPLFGPNHYKNKVQALFDDENCQLHPYWKTVLMDVTRPSAQSLVSQLDASSCPMGYNPLAVPFDPTRGSAVAAVSTTATTTAGKKGSFLDYCRTQKLRHPDCIILTRCGDFYETFGIDAILLVEHCGLNAMAGKAKAGCPIRNVQTTLDGLCRAGFRVAVLEEAAMSASTSSSKPRIKDRFLAQIVSAASPTYLYDLVLASGNDALVTSTTPRPFCGVLATARQGYTLVQVSLDARSLVIAEGLTPEAVACRLAAYPPADPLIYVPTPVEYQRYKQQSNSLNLPFLPSRRDLGGRLRTKLIPPNLVAQQAQGTNNEIDRVKKIVVSEVLKMNGAAAADSSSDDFTSVDDFVVVSNVPEATTDDAVQTQPLYVETATQLGLMDDAAIPSLVSCLVPDMAPAATRRFLRRYLLSPPPPTVADAMSCLVSHLKTSDAALPSLSGSSLPAVGNILAMLRAGQASAQVYGEILLSLQTTLALLELWDSGDDQSPIIQSLMTLLQYESGMAADPRSLSARCQNATKTIEAVVSPLHHHRGRAEEHHASDRISHFGDILPPAFLERNEGTWRGRVRPEAASETYAKVDQAARRLADAVARDFWILDDEYESSDTTKIKSPVVQDIFNNIIALKTVPADAKDKEKYFHPRDRFGKPLKNRMTTDGVQSALSDYVVSCEQACQDVTDALVQLSRRLYDEGHIPAIVQAHHANLILSTAFHHAIQANARGWNMATVHDNPGGEDNIGRFDGVWPYWMDVSEAVANTFDFKGMWLLTAPNMSGKSTIMRSTAAAALLSVCGLCAPLGAESTLRRFDHIFVRGASADVPSEKKSAFGAEMGDIAALLRSCGEKSLVFVDELGRGTSPRDGTRLAAAVLESMTVAGMSGIFATHLHDILDLPLESSNRIVRKRMAIHARDQSGNELPLYKWTYRLEDGVCTDSLALVTAQRFGLPPDVIERAHALGKFTSQSGDLKPAPHPGSEFDANSGQARTSPKSTEEFSMVRIAQVVEETVGGSSPLIIPPKWSVPVSLDGKSCTYVLQLTGEKGGRSQYYVGETDNLRNRIDQHRSKQGNWKNANAIAVPSNDKTQARAWESLIIQKLASLGVDLISTSDGRSLSTSKDQRANLDASQG